MFRYVAISLAFIIPALIPPWSGFSYLSLFALVPLFLAWDKQTKAFPLWCSGLLFGLVVRGVALLWLRFAGIGVFLFIAVYTAFLYALYAVWYSYCKGVRYRFLLRASGWVLVEYLIYGVGPFASWAGSFASAHWGSFLIETAPLGGPLLVSLMAWGISYIVAALLRSKGEIKKSLQEHLVLVVAIFVVVLLGMIYNPSTQYSKPFVVRGVQLDWRLGPYIDQGLGVEQFVMSMQPGGPVQFYLWPYDLATVDISSTVEAKVAPFATQTSSTVVVPHFQKEDDCKGAYIWVKTANATSLCQSYAFPYFNAALQTVLHGLVPENWYSDKHVKPNTVSIAGEGPWILLGNENLISWLRRKRVREGASWLAFVTRQQGVFPIHPHYVGLLAASLGRNVFYLNPYGPSYIYDSTGRVEEQTSYKERTSLEGRISAEVAETPYVVLGDYLFYVSLACLVLLFFKKKPRCL